MVHGVNKDKVVWRVADGEAVLLHAETSAYYGLNRVGTALWEVLVSQPLDSQGLLTWARQHFPDAPEGLAGDVAEFLSQLQAFGLLEDNATPQTSGAPTPTASSIPYEPPQITPFGELEKLILSGE